MARLRSDARKRVAERRAEEGATPPPFVATGPWPTVATTQSGAAIAMPERNQTPDQPYLHRECLVAAIGTSPPLGSQERPMTPLRVPGTPPYTWELTSPVKGRSSGLYVLHIGSTPQTSPMSRDPPNVIVNRRQLLHALHGKVTRGRRGHAGVRRRLQDPTEGVEPGAGSSRRVRGAAGRRQGGRGRVVRGTPRAASPAVPPAGWEPPIIVPAQGSPVVLRPRIPATASTAATDAEDDFVVDITQEDDVVDTFFSVTPQDLRCFNPGASPPPALVQAPVNSPSEHGYLDNRAFEKVVRVTVRTDTLDLDPGLVGDANGVRGVVVSRYYHHVTGTPMFQVDFGGAIGARAVRVSDSAVDESAPFEQTARTLFADDANPGGYHDCPSDPAEDHDSDDDKDWMPEYADYMSDQAAAESNSDSAAPDYSEDPMKELGLYSYDEDVSGWPFDRVFADDQWQDQSITLVNNTANFIGPQPGPTSAMASRPTEYFMRYWPPHILQRVVDETNR